MPILYTEITVVGSSRQIIDVNQLSNSSCCKQIMAYIQE